MSQKGVDRLSGRKERPLTYFVVRGHNTGAQCISARLKQKTCQNLRRNNVHEDCNLFLKISIVYAICMYLFSSQSSNRGIIFFVCDKYQITGNKNSKKILMCIFFQGLKLSVFSCITIHLNFWCTPLIFFYRNTVYKNCIRYAIHNDFDCLYT